MKFLFDLNMNRLMNGICNDSNLIFSEKGIDKQWEPSEVHFRHEAFADLEYDG